MPSINIHGSTMTGAFGNTSPVISMTYTIGTITRSGSTIKVPLSGYLNAEDTTFGFTISVSASIDSGSSKSFIYKDNMPDTWSSGKYSGSTTLSATNTSNDGTATLHIYMASNCPCYSGTSAHEVWYGTISGVPAASVKVTFNPNGGNWSGSTSSQSVTTTVGSSATISSNPTRTNYTFKEWNTKKDGSGTSYSGRTISSVSSDMTVYAQWTRITYQVTFNNNGGSGSMSSVTVNSGDSYSIPKCTFTGPTYTLTFDAQGGTVNGSPTYSVGLVRPFLSWNTKSDGTGTTYTVGKSYTLSAALTLYAIWGDPTIDTLYEATYKNAEFLGWYDGTSSSANRVFETTTITGNTTIYAHYNYYIVYYYNTSGSRKDYDSSDPDDDPDEGTDLGVFTSETKGYDETYTIISDYPTNVPEKEFASWNTESDGTGIRYMPKETYTENAPLNLYARYDKGKYTVIFDANKGQFSDGSTQKKYTNVEAGSSVNPPEEPTRKNHKFLGWLGNYSNIVQDVTIKALWSYWPIWIRVKDDKGNSYWEGYR